MEQFFIEIYITKTDRLIDWEEKTFFSNAGTDEKNYRDIKLNLCTLHSTCRL